MKNRLKDSTSPYLRQHAGNPVDWHPWGEAAITLAVRTGKPILLSIGYSACHWCHVMAHESFEDPETAGIMNEHFICIKVDREEHPDLDQIYMTFVQMTTGSGGWPLNVFLTPALEPFYGGTYFPPDDRYGRPSWKKVLLSVSHFYRVEKEALASNLKKIRQAYEMSLVEEPGQNLPNKEDLDHAAAGLAQLYDDHNGGLGGAPKFPSVQPLYFFLTQYYRNGDKKYLDMVTHTLIKMGRGGIYDHVGGGFARYAVDEEWLVPHFEKMLYDNAQLASLYIDVFCITGQPFHAQIAKGILAFTAEQLQQPEGGFYSSLDADSDGREGKYYIWDKSEIEKALGELSPVFCDYFGITGPGNFEGANILHITDDIKVTAEKFNYTIQEIKSVIDKSLAILKTIREKRIPPGLDDKILTSWNALMISAFARAYQVFSTPLYREIVEKNIGFIRTYLSDGNRIFRSYSGGERHLDGYLDDYAYLIRALLDSYEAVLDESYLQWAYDLLMEVNVNFHDPGDSGYFYTASGHRHLLYRMKDNHDQSIPSSNGIMLQNLLRLYTITEQRDLLIRAEKMMQRYLAETRENPYAYASYLSAMDHYLTGATELLIFRKNQQSCSHLLDPVHKRYIPHRITLVSSIDHPIPLLSKNMLEGKQCIDDLPTAYVCRNFSCSPPVTDPSELEIYFSNESGMF
jgi:uncharacterized protein YyaL (SSP411 family)